MKTYFSKTYASIPKFVVSKIFQYFQKKSLLLTKAAFIWRKKKQ